MSRSIYEQSDDPTIILKLIVLLLFKNQTIQLLRISCYTNTRKTPFLRRISIMFFTLVPIVRCMINERRYFNRSNIIHEHPYAIQINAYELRTDTETKTDCSMALSDIF